MSDDRLFPNEPDQDQASYQQLKDWYLARLRKRALQDKERNLTPAALINADKSLIETMVLHAVATGSGSKSRREPGVFAARALIVYLLALISVFISAVIHLSGNLREALNFFFQLSLGSLVLKADLTGACAKMGATALAIPIIVFALPAIILFTAQSAAGRLSRSVHALRHMMLCNLALLLPVFLLIYIMATNSVPQAQLLSEYLLCLFAWLSIFSVLAFLECRAAYIKPLNTALNYLAAANKQHILVKDEPNESLQMLAEIIKQRDELISRELLIVDASAYLLLVFDRNWRITAFNQAVKESFAYLPSEIAQSKFTDFILPEDQTMMENVLSTCQASKQSQSVDCRILTKFRQAIDLRIEIEYSETQECFFASALNINDQKALERERSEFVSMLGHDIKSPLTSALTIVQVLGRGIFGAVSDAVCAQISNVETSLKRLIIILDELLEFESLSAGQLNLTLDTVDIGELAEKALAELGAQALNSSIVLKADILHVSLSGDRVKLMRVISNLLTNAVKFSPAHSSITLSISKPKSNTVELRVKDEGPGIASQYHQLIFERFHRLSSSSNIEGKGLGLAIAKQIIELHGGIIGVDSEPGRGSGFWFTLPL